MAAAPTPSPGADRNLLFGILALHNAFISRGALVAAMQAWLQNKTRTLGSILVEQRALTAERNALLEALVHEHLQLHDNDPQRSLADVTSAGPIREALEQFADADLQASLIGLSTTAAAEARGAEAAGLPSTVAYTIPTEGRFRILRPYAQGGLGKVFVALDQELHREVALKEMRERHAARADSRARFLLEAEVTGGLEHPGIVPVYSLGCYPDGRPFYAMRFVRGDNLQDAIQRFHQTDALPRTPAERTLALRELLGRFVDVCNALAYAHSRGVLHRDVKPGNILLGAYGETLVVDWGLAKALGKCDTGLAEAPLEPLAGADSALTQMGTVIGTPAYMSPEQAAGRLDELGPASDVYGLGATLYHLLTGQPPFQDPDTAALLKHVQAGAFARPGQVHPAVDAGLEAICLKAMAFKPHERYATPRALADDVERWLADEPVTAHRETMLARLGRWARHHRGWAAAGLAAVLVGALGLGLVTVLATTQNRELAAANRREREAAELAQHTVEDMTSPEALAFLEAQKELRPPQRHFLEQAVAYYRQVASGPATGEEAKARQARAYFQMGHLDERLGLNTEAETAYRAALEELAQLATNHPEMSEYRKDLARSHINLGNVLREIGKPAEAEAEYRAALKEQERLAGEYPQSRDFRHDLAASHNNLGIILAGSGRWPEANTEFQAALKEFERLVIDYPEVPAYGHELARNHTNLGTLLAGLGKWPQAEAEFQVALQEQERLANDHPQVAEFRQELARSHNGLGSVFGARVNTIRPRRSTAPPSRNRNAWPAITPKSLCTAWISGVVIATLRARCASPANSLKLSPCTPRPLPLSRTSFAPWAAMSRPVVFCATGTGAGRSRSSALSATLRPPQIGTGPWPSTTAQCAISSAWGGRLRRRGPVTMRVLPRRPRRLSRAARPMQTVCTMPRACSPWWLPRWWRQARRTGTPPAQSGCSARPSGEASRTLQP
jgi:serine/threonine-protein kinase